jgi:hypothetical protein
VSLAFADLEPTLLYSSALHKKELTHLKRVTQQAELVVGGRGPQMGGIGVLMALRSKQSSSQT